MSDWYVGEIYKYISHQLISKYTNISFEVIDILYLQQKYCIQDYSKNTNPSFFNKYNFILHNPSNNKTFINSLHDYAPLCLYPEGGVEHFCVQCFGFASNYNEQLVHPIIKYNPKPSFYVLENYSDLDKIQKYRHTTKTINKAFFLGLMHSSRPCVQNILKDSILFDIKNKNIDNNWKNKEDYFKYASQYSMILSLDGAAKICYRDLESLGMGNILVRESLNTKLFNNLIPDEHYIEIIKEEEKHLVCDSSKADELKNLIEDRLLINLKNKDKIDYIINNGFNWYNNNCIPEKQFDIVENLTDHLNILFD